MNIPEDRLLQLCDILEGLQKQQSDLLEQIEFLYGTTSIQQKQIYNLEEKVKKLETKLQDSGVEFS